MPIVHQRKESEIGVDFDQGIDLGATEFHTSHDELNETIAESRPSLFASLGLTTSRVADGGKGGAFETIEETEDEKGKEPPNRQMNHSIFIARTSRFLAAMASIAVSIGAIAGAMKGKKPNRSDVEVPDGREDEENEGRKGILEKMNRRMAAFASIVASAAIIVGATSHYWASDPYFGNAMCEKDEECKSGVCRELNEDDVLYYFKVSPLDTDLKPLFPASLQGEEKDSRKQYYKSLLNHKVCYCTDHDHCLHELDFCHNPTKLCYDKGKRGGPPVPPETSLPSSSPSSLPSLPSTESAQPSSASEHSFSKLYEVDIDWQHKSNRHRPQDLSFSLLDICKFAKAAVVLVDIYEPINAGYKRASYEFSDAQLCSALYVHPRIATKCSVLRQKELFPSRDIRLYFLMTWRSRYYDESSIEILGETFPREVNGWGGFKTFLNSSGFGSDTHIHVNKVEDIVFAEGDFDWVTEPKTETPTEMPSSSEQQPSNIAPPNGSSVLYLSEHRRARTYTQKFYVKKSDEFDGLDLLVFKLEILQRFLSPDKYGATSADLPRLVLFDLSFQHHSTDEHSAILIEYHLIWIFCSGDSEYDMKLYEKYEGIGEAFATFVNHTVSQNILLEELHRVGIQSVASVSDIGEMNERNWNGDQASTYCTE